MDLYQQQQFDFLLHTAVERYVERIQQRNEGADNALARLRANPDGEGIWLSQYVDAVFTDFLLDNAAGACFVLQALAKRTLPASATGMAVGKVEATLIGIAKAVFAELLRQKTEEALEQASGYQAVDFTSGENRP